MADTAGPPGHGSGRRCARRLAWLHAVAVAATLGGVALPPRAAQAQAAPAAPAAPQAAQDRLTQAELEQLLAPIALHPDPLLMQMLMASTYPLEIVQAKRWLGQGQNASLRGDALVAALNAQPWDPSVKSLVPFPDVLTMMNDQLDWTHRLGDAVLAQQEDVMNAIQVLRGRAQAAGALQSGPQQTVTVTQTVAVAPQAAGAPARAVAPPPQTIVIAPAQPETVYVPAYNPAVVYGAWPYPQTPPYYYPPPVGWGVGNALLRGMAFAGGVAAVGSLWNWATPGWGRGDIDVNVNRYNNINVNRTQITGNTGSTTRRTGTAWRTATTRCATGEREPARRRARRRDRPRTARRRASSSAAAWTRPNAERGSAAGPGSRAGRGRAPRPGRPRAGRRGRRRGRPRPRWRRPPPRAGDRRRRGAAPRRQPRRRRPAAGAAGRADAPGAAGPAGRRRWRAGKGGRATRRGEPRGAARGAGAGAAARRGAAGRRRGRRREGGRRRRRPRRAAMRTQAMIRITMLAGLAALALAGGAAAQAPAAEAPAAQQAPRPVPPQAFRSPEDGFAAFVAALRARSEAQGVRVLGMAGYRFLRSGDPVADRTARDRFLAAYDSGHEILRPAPGRAVLQVGADRWPLPIPMLERGGAWRFDAVAAGQEIADRRIGRNELSAIETLRAVADAQREFARTAGRDGAFQAYARRFFSSPGGATGSIGQVGQARRKARSARWRRRRAPAATRGARAGRRSPSTATSSASWRRRAERAGRGDRLRRERADDRRLRRARRAGALRHLGHQDLHGQPPRRCLGKRPRPRYGARRRRDHGLRSRAGLEPRPGVRRSRRDGVRGTGGGGRTGARLRRAALTPG